MSQDTEILGRLVRIETRLAKLMTYLGVSPLTGKPLTPNEPKPNHANNPNQSQRHPDRG